MATLFNLYAQHTCGLSCFLFPHLLSSVSFGNSSWMAVVTYYATDINKVKRMFVICDKYEVIPIKPPNWKQLGRKGQERSIDTYICIILSSTIDHVE